VLAIATMRGMEASEREKQMRRLLQRREREGLTYRQAAALEPGVTPNQLFWWRRKLFGRRDSPPPRKKPQQAFVEFVATPSTASSRIEIVTRGERRLLVDSQVDESLLERIVRALERC
jgi:transposase-like protein